MIFKLPACLHVWLQCSRAPAGAFGRVVGLSGNCVLSTGVHVAHRADVAVVEGEVIAASLATSLAEVLRREGAAVEADKAAVTAAVVAVDATVGLAVSLL